MAATTRIVPHCSSIVDDQPLFLGGLPEDCRGVPADDTSFDTKHLYAFATMLIVKKAPFVVTLVADLRPLVVGLNRELLGRGAGPVQREELAAIDTMLHDGPPDCDSPPTRCRHCGGYVCAGTDEDDSCLNCGRPVNARRPLEDVIQEIAQHLIERRREWSQVSA